MSEDISIYLEPVRNAYALKDSGGVGSIGEIIEVNDGKMPELEGHKLAIIGVAEGRNTIENEGCVQGPQKIREQLYQLYFESADFRILDLGDIKAGHTIEDSLFAIEQVNSQLMQLGIIPIIIGGGHFLSLGMYRAYTKLERMTNVVCIDPRFDIGDADEEIDSRNFLSEIILHKPNFLFNYSVVGYQSYLVNQEMVKMMNKMFFDIHRLGEVVHEIREMESVMRAADMVSIDISAVRRSDAPGINTPLPNGLYGEQLCQLCAYAGMNEKTSSLGLFEYNPSYDVSNQTSQLLAQAIWCFIDGYFKRSKEEVGLNEESFVKYRVQLRDQYELVFHKSKLTDRWWMEIPYPESSDQKFKRFQMVPCSYKDYEKALNQEMPDKWWQTY
jgi:arginase family enzyme